MSSISPQSEQSSKEETAVLTALTSLTFSSTGQLSKKTGTSSFENTAMTYLDMISKGSVIVANEDNVSSEVNSITGLKVLQNSEGTISWTTTTGSGSVVFNNSPIFKTLVTLSEANLIFTGSGSGLPYGECYGDAIGWQQVNAVQNTWYDVLDSDMISDELHLVTHDGNGKLTLLHAGVYLISYSFVITSTHANEHLHFGISIDDSASPHTSSDTHMETKFANEETEVSHSFLLTVTAGQTLNAMIETVDVNELHLIVVQVGS